MNFTIKKRALLIKQKSRNITRQFMVKKNWQKYFTGSYIVLIVMYLLAATHVSIAAGSWTQTDWSGGAGSSTTNQFVSTNAINASSNGQVSLSSTNSVTNGTLDSNTNGWVTPGSYMTPGVVQSKGFRVSGSNTTATNTFTSTPIEGNTILAVHSTTANPGTITTPSGFVIDAQATNTNTGGKNTVFRKVAGASEPSAITVNNTTGTALELDIYEISGIETQDPIDQVTTSESGAAAGPTFSPGTINNSTPSVFAFASAGFSSSPSGGTSVISWSDSFTRGIAPGLSPFGNSAYKTVTSPGSITTTITTTSNNIKFAGSLIAYKARSTAGVSHDSVHSYSGGGSARVVTTGSSGNFAQYINAGDTNNYLLEAYAYKDGSSLSSSDAELYVNGNTITTSYTDMGGGWFKLSASIPGTSSSQPYGVQVKPNKTINVDNISLTKFENTGMLLSNIYDTGTISNWGTLTYSHSGNGTVEVRVRSSNNASMSGAPSFSSCLAVGSGNDISSNTGGCVADVERYIQYEVTLNTSDTSQTPVFEEFTIDFTDADSTPPITNAHDIQMFKSNGGELVAEDGWNNSSTPYFEWGVGQDDQDGSGIKGYCLYLGSDETADPITTKGLLGTSPVDTQGACQFAVSSNSVDLSTLNYLGSQIPSSNNSYYISIKAIDNVNNVYVGSAATFAFKHDVDAPNNPAFISAPSNFINNKSATLTWSTAGNDSASDVHSGVSGLQYKIGSNGTWYGDDHSGSEDSYDLLDNDGSYATQSTPDFAALTEGNNVIYFRTWDQAGNVTTATVNTVLKINTSGAPSSPRNLVATPSSNTQNSFAFSWIAPSSFVGQAGNLTYCYTVNTQPTEQTCNFTAAGVTSVPAGAFATQPGENTFYVVAQDESSGINYATAASVSFTANTSAPGIPLNLDIADTSVKSTSNWRLVISWESPEDTGAGVSKYEIYRSANNNTYTLAGSTSGSSYVDTSLQSQLYYYKVRACDSANNCGAYSNVESRTPTGRFTTPPTLESTPRVSSIGTKKATVNWETDRNSDSKVAFGIQSGSYFSTEAYNSTNTKNHSVELTNLNPGTTYYYTAKWTDEDGNTGQSSELAFTTLPPPSVQDVTVPIVNLNFATVQYTTIGAHKAKVYYGKSSGFGGVVELNTSVNRSTYSSSLTELEDGTKYFYKINTFDADGNEYEGTTLSFTTPPAPKITNLRFQPIENEPSSSQKITWDTNVPSSSELSYGTSALSESTLNGTQTTKHELVIRGLKDDSVYRLVARSRDASGNLAISDEQTFKTALDTRPPQVSDVVIDTSIKGTGTDARGQIVISWRTDEPATSQAAFGAGGGNLTNTSTEDTRLTYEHLVVISDLSTSQVYYVEPRSYDKGRNLSSGEQQVAIVGRASENVLGIIVNALQQLFGVN